MRGGGAGGAEPPRRDQRRPSRRLGLRARAHARRLPPGARPGRRLRRAGSGRDQGRRAHLPARSDRWSGPPTSSSAFRTAPPRSSSRASGDGRGWPTTSRWPRSRRLDAGSWMDAQVRRRTGSDLRRGGRAHPRQGRSLSRVEDAGDLRRPGRGLPGAGRSGPRSAEATRAVGRRENAGDPPDLRRVDGPGAGGAPNRRAGGAAHRVGGRRSARASWSTHGRARSPASARPRRSSRRSPS